jgi:hypothetical protein
VPASPVGLRDRIGSAIFIVAAGILLATMLIYIVDFGAGPADSTTYLHAAERLNAGHSLYAIAAGDVPIDPGLFGAGSSAPLLAPPLVVAPWRVLALVPPTVAIATWWIAMTALIVAVFGGMFRESRAVAGVTLLLSVPVLLWQLIGGNMNAILLAGVVASWVLWRDGRVQLAGVLLGMLIILKLIPLPLGVWLLAIAPIAALGLIEGVALGLAASLLAAGPDSAFAYLGVLRDAGTSANPMSIGGTLETLGVNSPLLGLVPTAILVVGCATLIGLRRRPALGYILAVGLMVFGSGAVHAHTFALLIAAAAPFAWRVFPTDGGRDPWPGRVRWLGGRGTSAAPR